MGYIPYIRREKKGEEIKGNQRDAKNKNPTVYIGTATMDFGEDSFLGFVYELDYIFDQN